MRLPWEQINREEYELMCFELARKLGFEQRAFVDSGPSLSTNRDIIGNKVSDILPGINYQEKWLISPIEYFDKQLSVSDIEPLKNWADEPKHEIDYVLIMTLSTLSKSAEEWILRFNRFPIKKYKIKLMERAEVEQLVLSDERILEKYFPNFLLQPTTDEESRELCEIVTRRLLNFRSDLSVIDFSLAVLFTFPEDMQEEIVKKIAHLWSAENYERLKKWNAGWVIVRMAKLKPSLVPMEVVEKVARDKTAHQSIRALASHVYCWLAETNSQMVSAEILGELADPDGDYFVYMPAMRALANMMTHDHNVITVIQSLVNHQDIKRRDLAAKILISIAEENPVLISSSMVSSLESDEDENIREKGKLLREKIESFWEAPIKKEFEDARQEFEAKNYSKAQSMFAKLARKGNMGISQEARWWSGYCLYMIRDYVFAFREFESFGSLDGESCQATSQWWLSLCLEKMGKIPEAIMKLESLLKCCKNAHFSVRISPEKETSPEELNSLLLKRLNELRDKLTNR